MIAGGATQLMNLARLAPRVGDRYMEKTLFKQQRTSQAASADRPANLYRPVRYDGGERGRNWKGRTKEPSALTWAEMRPAATVAGLMGLILGAFAIANRVSPFE